MKMRYVKPEMAVENLSTEDAIMSILTVSGTSAQNQMETKGRFDFEEEASTADWENGLW